MKIVILVTITTIGSEPAVATGKRPPPARPPPGALVVAGGDNGSNKANDDNNNININDGGPRGDRRRHSKRPHFPQSARASLFPIRQQALLLQRPHEC